MANNNPKITINRQDTYTRTLNLFDNVGDPIDATGWTIYFTVRKTVAETSINDDTDAAIQDIIPGEASGVQTVNFSSTETDIDPGNYLYDIEIKKGDSTIISSEAAPFIIKGDITRTT